jgi:hypothetical protein
MTMKSSMSRRAFLPLVAGAALSPVLLVPQSARAQGINWQIYRPDGLGFEAEMPGEPKIKIEKGERDDVIVRTVEAEVDFDQITFDANFQEYRKLISMREELMGQQLLARGIEGRVVRDVTFTMNGFEGREYAIESTVLNAIVRVVLVKNRRIALSAIGDRAVDGNAVVRRFLDSLKLLP